MRSIRVLGHFSDYRQNLNMAGTSLANLFVGSISQNDENVYTGRRLHKTRDIGVGCEAVLSNQAEVLEEGTTTFRVEVVLFANRQTKAYLPLALFSDENQQSVKMLFRPQELTNFCTIKLHIRLHCLKISP